jgi:hypothetical protein
MSARPAFIPPDDDQVAAALLANFDVVVLAFEIADEAARSDVECCGTPIVINGQLWYELSKLTADEQKLIATGLRYLHLRGEKLSFRVICHLEYPYLRRFESKP